MTASIWEWDQSCALLPLTARLEKSSRHTTGRAAFTARYQEVDVSASLVRELVPVFLQQQAPTATMVRAPAPAPAARSA